MKEVERERQRERERETEREREREKCIRSTYESNDRKNHGYCY
jgi:hypothetical protein